MGERTLNRKVVLVSRPPGTPAPENFRLEEEEPQGLEDGEVRIATEHLSIDAFIRTTLGAGSLHGMLPIGATVVALGVGRVVETRSPALAPGDPVFGPLGAQTLSALPAAALRKLDDARPLPAWLGVLGLTTGVTAYFGVRDVGAVRAGETMVVSGAAGAVGSVAAQIARIEGAHVIGIAGGPYKVRYLIDELGLDAGIDYKGEDVGARLGELAPDGVDVYFDNVGGELLDVVLDRIREGARIAICGAISQYHDMTHVRGPSLYLRLAERHARMEGFTVNHFADRFGEAEAQLARWLDEGQLHLREQVEKGIESFPRALGMLFDGGHTGKLLVRL
jgi:hypothetical protein